MKVFQREIILSPKKRGFHLVTNELQKEIPELKQFKAGLAHFFVKHTSASLTINENADPDVRTDMENHFNKMVPETASHYLHTLEGPDDMTSHIKASILGSAVTVPVTDGTLNLGTWQGIYLCEHRNSGGRRKILVTIFGETKT